VIVSDDAGQRPKTASRQVPLSEVLSHPLVVIYLVSLVAALPALLSGAMAQGTDSIFHARWQQYFAEQLWSGDIYPRWLLDANGGFGSPVFFIYPPFAHYVTAALFPLMPDPQSGAVRLGISAWLAMFASGVTCFYWLRSALPAVRIAALVGALVYMLAPYHLYVDVYQRGAFAEIWAFVWPPITLMLLHRLNSLKALTLSLLALSIAGLLITHAPSCLILIPSYLLYALLLDWKSGHLRHAIWLTAACALGCLLAGFYLGTALTHTRYINTAALFGGRNMATRWLIGGGIWADPVIQWDIEISVILQAGLGVILGALALMKCRRGERYLPTAALMFTLISLFMMSVLSQPIWALETPLNQVQFPWRFMILLSLGCALAVAAISAHVFRDGSPLPMLNKAGQMLLVSIPVMLLGVNGFMYAGLSSPALPPALLAVGAVDPFDMNWDAPEYQLAPRSEIEGIYPPGQRLHLPASAGAARIVEWRSRSISLDVDLQAATLIAVRQFNYTGWNLSTTYVGDDAPQIEDGKSYLQIRATPGHYVIRMSMGRTIDEKIGLMASAAGCFTLLALMFAGWRRLRRQQG
jgi:hypothetical protein